MYSQTTIQSLPDDVLLDTFMQHKPFRSNDIDITAWLAIPRVCRRWRALCLASALYWTHVVMPNPTYLRLVLERSRQASLVLRINTEMEHVVECLALLVAHIHHTKYLNLHHRKTPRAAVAHNYISHLLQQPMPQMRGLHLHFDTTGAQPLLMTLHGAVLPSLPALRLLDLRGVRLDLANTRSISQLTSIHLEDLYFSDMYGALTDMPNVREAALVLRDPVPGESLPQSKSLVWPKLQYLEYSCTPNAARIFWETLSVPDPARLTWCIHEPLMETPALTPQYEKSLREVIRAHLSKHPAAAPSEPRLLPSLTLTTVPKGVSFDWYEDILMHASHRHHRDTALLSYAVSVKFMMPFTLLTIRNVPLDGVQSLSIDEQVSWFKYYHFTSEYPSPWLLLPHLHNLRVLLLRNYRVGSGILKHLVPNDGTKGDELLLPALEHITIESTDLLTGSGYELLDYLKRRARVHRWLKGLTIRKCTMSSHMVQELDVYVREPVSWDYISTSIPS